MRSFKIFLQSSGNSMEANGQFFFFLALKVIFTATTANLVEGQKL